MKKRRNKEWRKKWKKKEEKEKEGRKEGKKTVNELDQRKIETRLRQTNNNGLSLFPNKKVDHLKIKTHFEQKFSNY